MGVCGRKTAKTQGENLKGGATTHASNEGKHKNGRREGGKSTKGQLVRTLLYKDRRTKEEKASEKNGEARVPTQEGIKGSTNVLGDLRNQNPAISPGGLSSGEKGPKGSKSLTLDGEKRGQGREG